MLWLCLLQCVFWSHCVAFYSIMEPFYVIFLTALRVWIQSSKRLWSILFLILLNNEPIKRNIKGKAKWKMLQSSEQCVWWTAGPSNGKYSGLNYIERPLLVQHNNFVVFWTPAPCTLHVCFSLAVSHKGAVGSEITHHLCTDVTLLRQWQTCRWLRMLW